MDHPENSEKMQMPNPDCQILDFTFVFHEAYPPVRVVLQIGVMDEVGPYLTRLIRQFRKAYGLEV